MNDIGSETRLMQYANHFEEYSVSYRAKIASCADHGAVCGVNLESKEQ
jgi:hypothetical protein